MTTPRPRPTRPRAAVAAACSVVLVTVVGCGQQGTDRTSLRPADRAAVDTCTEVVDLLEQAGRTVRSVRGGHDVPGAGRRLTRLVEQLQTVADGARDDVVGQAVQEVVDSLRVYVVVLPDPGLGAHADAEADVTGRLEGFRRTCPAAVSGHGRTGSWVAGSATTVLSARPGGRHGRPLLVLRAVDDGGSVELTDHPVWVERTWGGTYRVAVRARVSSGSGRLTLEVVERDGGRVVGTTSTTAALSGDVSLVGLRHRSTGRGGPLALRVRVEGLDAGAAVELDGLGVARG